MTFRFSGCLVLAALLVQSAPAWSFEASAQEVDAFLLADRNRDGHLSRAEFKLFVRAMADAGQPTAQNIRLFGAYTYAFGIVDKNSDGLASPEELRTADDGYRAGN